MTYQILANFYYSTNTNYSARFYFIFSPCNMALRQIKTSLDDKSLPFYLQYVNPINDVEIRYKIFINPIQDGPFQDCFLISVPVSSADISTLSPEISNF